MIFAISKLIADLFGLDISKVQRVVFWILVVIGITILLFLGLWVRSCQSGRQARLDREQADKAKQAIAEQDRKAQIEVLSKSDADVKVADGIISNSKAETVNAVQESKRKWSEATDAEITAELERRLKE